MHSLLFLGTSDFAVPSLTALLQDPRFRVVGVITQPDKPVGRHAILTPPPIKILAESHGIPLFQPEKLKDLVEIPTADAFVIVSYGKILPRWFIDRSPHGVVNVHGSLLPRWRGASPIQAALAAGDQISGVTIMKIDEQMDHGPILAQAEETVLDTDTAQSLHDRLARLGGSILPDVLAGYLTGTIHPREQDHALATTCGLLTRDHGRVDWNKTSDDLERYVRAYDPWPGTWTDKEGKRLKILAVQRAPGHTNTQPGEFFIRDQRPHVTCGNGTALELLRVQPEGKKPMSGKEYARGVMR